MVHQLDAIVYTAYGFRTRIYDDNIYSNQQHIYILIFIAHARAFTANDLLAALRKVQSQTLHLGAAIFACVGVCVVFFITHL